MMLRNVKIRKRTIALLLAVLMVCFSLPVNVFAEGEEKHVHGEACTEKTLICELDEKTCELSEHTHGETCSHSHEDKCYNISYTCGYETQEAKSEEPAPLSSEAQKFYDAAKAVNAEVIDALLSADPIDEAAIAAKFEELFEILVMYEDLPEEEQTEDLEALYFEIGGYYMSLDILGEDASPFAVTFTDELKDCLTGMKLYHKKADGTWEEVKDGDIVNVEDTYKIAVSFAEVADGNQFKNPSYYTFPNTVQILNNASGSFDDGKGNTLGTYTVDTSGKVTVNFNNVTLPSGTVPWNDSETNCSMKLDFESTLTGVADSDSYKIDLGNGTYVVVKLRTGSTLDVQKGELQKYDPETRKVTYKVTAKANGKVSGAKLVDTYSKEMILDMNSVKIDGSPLNQQYITTGGSDPKTFEIGLGDIDTGETKEITYTMKVDDSYFDSTKPETQLLLKNNSKVSGTGIDNKPVSDDDDCKVTAEQTNIKKVVQKIEKDKGTITWKITLGDGFQGTDVSGKVKDTIPTGLTLDGDITVEYYTVGNSNMQKLTFTDPANIDIPSGTYKAEITYQTRYDPTKVPIGGTSYTNTASHANSGWTVTATAGAGGIEPKIDKTHSYAGSDKITYVVQIDVPAGMDQAPCFYLYDKLEIITGKSYNAANSVTNMSITVDGTPITNWIKADAATMPNGTTSSPDPNDFYIFFGGGTSITTSKWDKSTASTIVITYELDPTGAVYENNSQTGKTINDELDANATLKNTAAVYYYPGQKKEDPDDYYRTDIYMNKAAVNVTVSDGTNDGYIDYAVEFKPGLSKQDDKFLFTDNFDSRLDYVPGSVYIEKITTDGVSEKYYYDGRNKGTGDITDWDATTPGQMKLDSSMFFKPQKTTQMTKYNDKDNIYVVHYRLSVPKTVDLTTTSSFKNTASAYNSDETVLLCQDVKVVGYPTDLLSKDGAQSAQAANGDIVIYTIDINQKRQQLSKNGTGRITLTDTQDGTKLQLKPDTIKVTNATNGKDLGQLYTIYGGGTKIVFDLPDQEHIRITYEMKVIASGTVTVDNSVKLEGYDQYTVDSIKQFNVSQSQASGAGGHSNFDLFKVDKDTNAPLAGAVYKLYSTTSNTNTSDWIDYTIGNNTVRYCCAADASDFTKSVTFTTNAQGYVNIDHEVLATNQNPAKSYLLVEQVAPTGYKLDQTPQYFVFNPANPTKDDVMYNGQKVLTNEKQTPDELQLEVTKSVTGNPPTSPLFTFKISDDTSDNVTSPLPADAQGNTVTEAKVSGAGKAKFEKISFTAAGTYQYIIEEDRSTVPANWTYDSNSYKVTVVVGNKTDGSPEIQSKTYEKFDSSGNSLGTAAALSSATDISFSNTYTAKTSLTIPVTKTVSGPARPAGTTTSFDFTLSTTNNAPMPKANNPITISVGNGVSASQAGSFDAIDYTAVTTTPWIYEITETSAAGTGFTNSSLTYQVWVSVTDDGNGGLKATPTFYNKANLSSPVSKAEFVNTYDYGTTKAQFDIKKTLTGNARPNNTKAFSFVVADDPSDSVNSPLPNPDTITVTDTDNTNAGAVYTNKFKEITYSAPGDYKYIITETPGAANDGYTYDSTQHKVTVSVTDVGGKLQATVSTDGVTGTTSAFTNSYKPTPTTAELPVAKTFSTSSQARPSVQNFEFTLTANNSATPMPTATGGDKVTIADPGTGKGTGKFGTITFTEAGIYTYTVSETGPSPKPAGYSYGADRVFTVEVKDTNGVLSASWTVDNSSTLNDAAAFENSYDVGSVSETFSVKKTVTGNARPNSGKQFEFKIIDDPNDGVISPLPNPSVIYVTDTGNTNTPAIYANTFGTITFNTANTYKYLISETKSSSNDGYTYDQTQYSVTVVVTNVGNALSSSVTIVNLSTNKTVSTIDFSNAYTSKPTMIELPVSKTFSATSLTRPTPLNFEFTLSPGKAGDPMPLGTGNVISITDPGTGTGTGKFGTITFTKAGTYTYTVSETGPSPVPSGYTYAPDRKITVDVTDTNGVLSASWTVDNSSTPNAAAAFVNSYSGSSVNVTIDDVKHLKILDFYNVYTPEIPKTGYGSSNAALLTLGAGAMLIFLAAFAGRKKRRAR